MPEEEEGRIELRELGAAREGGSPPIMEKQCVLNFSFFTCIIFFFFLSFSFFISSSFCMSMSISISCRRGEKQYAEYFMPVNESKKSFRGEKMYVNKSTTRTVSCRRACCWLLGLALLAGAVTVAVLIGTGVISTGLSQQRVDRAQAGWQGRRQPGLKELDRWLLPPRHYLTYLLPPDQTHPTF
jgi:hypothetical protein